MIWSSLHPAVWRSAQCSSPLGHSVPCPVHFWECPRRSHSFTGRALSVPCCSHCEWLCQLQFLIFCLNVPICCLFAVSPDPALFINLPLYVGRLKSDSPLASLSNLTKAHFYWDFLACSVLQLVCHVSDSPLDLLHVGEFSLLWRDVELNSYFILFVEVGWSVLQAVLSLLHINSPGWITLYLNRKISQKNP